MRQTPAQGRGWTLVSIHFPVFTSLSTAYVKQFFARVMAEHPAAAPMIPYFPIFLTESNIWRCPIRGELI
jgi:hypothetical protein